MHLIISPVLDFFKKTENQVLKKETKLYSKNKIVLNYWKDFKINKKWLLFKNANNVEQVVLPEKLNKCFFKKLNNKMEHSKHNNLLELTSKIV